MSGSPVYIEERTYYPTNYNAADEWQRFNIFGNTLGVYYRGDGKWCVSMHNDKWSDQWTHTGKRIRMPQKFQQIRWCRMDFETACRIASEHVDEITCNGKTWDEWVEWHAAQDVA